MDEMFERLCKIYPDSKFVLIPKYDFDKWEGKEYDSSNDNKAAIGKWKSQPYDKTTIKPFIEQGFRVGWIVPKGYCVIDVDNKEEPQTQDYILKILEKFEVKYSYNYTFHGIHMLFRDEECRQKSDSKLKCGINLIVDSRANNTGYIILPTNDPHRNWGEWNEFVEELPYFLKPIIHDKSESFIGMQDGDGRNDALIRWRYRLMASHKLTDKEIEKCIRIVNENLFETAIPKEELFKTVLRDLKKKEIPVESKENPFNKIAEDISDKYDIIYTNRTFYKFEGTYHKPMDECALEKLIHEEISRNLSHSSRQEIIEFLKVKCFVENKDINTLWYKIPCKNGILNLVTGELGKPNSTEVNTMCIPWTYNEDPPPSPRIMEFMKQITKGDLQKIQFLYEIAGYCMLRRNLFEKFFVFRGEGGTGKSTYTNILVNLIGRQNVSNISLTDFDKDYHLATTENKLLNVDDDVVDGKSLQYTGRFKSFVSGELISARQIYKDVVTFAPFATLVFSCNRLPQIMDKTSGMYRRMVLVEINNKIDNPDPNFMLKITESDMEYFFFKAVEAIKNALDVGHMSIVQSEAHLLEQFRRRQSSLQEWLFEHDVRLRDILATPCSMMYRQFSEWCDNCGYKSKPNMFTFKEDVCNLYGVATDMQREGQYRNKMMFVKYGEYNAEFKPF